MANRLVQKVQVPALPIPKDSPLKQYLDDLNNILRLFFNLLANAVNNVFGELGGRFLDVPNALYFSTVDQPIAVVDTAQVVTFNQTYLESGFSINCGSNSQITAHTVGFITFSLLGKYLAARLRLRIYICGFRETALIWVIQHENLYCRVLGT